MAKKFYPPVPTAPVPALIDKKFKNKKNIKTSKVVGSKILKGGGSLIKKGIKFGLKTSAIGLGYTALQYAKAGPKRRYAKAPKFGENIDIRNKMIGYGKD
tara:strand:+ start:360 stop:659 length:300 start_codon:yes stop_codon:yes gene_type:complete